VFDAGSLTDAARGLHPQLIGARPVATHVANAPPPVPTAIAMPDAYGLYNHADVRGPRPFPYPPVIKASPLWSAAAAEN
jgi:hypothetical protein